MNLLALLIALNSPVLDCKAFESAIIRSIEMYVMQNHCKTDRCRAVSDAILLDNPKLRNESVIDHAPYQLYAKRTCVIYNKIR